MPQPDYFEAHSHSSHHRKEIERSKCFGCFYCLSIFLPCEIERWIDGSESLGTTAQCPVCHIDSVIGDASGFLITAEFLHIMHNRWFSVVASGSKKARPK